MELLAEGPIGWGITPFEGNYYIQKKYIKSKGFRNNFIPGFCPYKFFYIWQNFKSQNDHDEKMLGWKYVIPNPIFPFIWFRLGLPGNHHALKIERL